MSEYMTESIDLSLEDSNDEEAHMMERRSSINLDELQKDGDNKSVDSIMLEVNVIFNMKVF